ncbi:uncharacterized protein B0H18DRAFT_1052651 [Fomitopsis serialis]|uniref:uncharacterized protein n=1 Tax=Fomitopsis serialis TaxID=139415 RepID=UPI002007A0FB|nr:uncharacterized protein B0H18DRAFT_1052651 [Neoantrodia serialis]KAH9912711.1 hypothetical protein B0H18DRAFT_1052651 [Neoantrodia serialis]
MIAHSRRKAFNMFNSHYPKSDYPGFLLRSEVQDILDNWEKLVKIDNEDKLAMFIGRRILQVQKVEKHVTLCCDWADRQVQLRLEDVISRLRGIGWGPELDYLQRKDYAPIRKHEQMRAARRLSDRAWQNMRGDMVKCMQQTRQERLEHELRYSLPKRWPDLEFALEELVQHSKAQVYCLGLGDIALSPQIRQIMCAPENEEVNFTNFTALRGCMGQVVEEWVSYVSNDLRGLLTPRQSGGSAAKLTAADTRNTVDPLELATTSFRCLICNHRLYYPGALAHACLRAPLFQRGHDDVYGQFLSKKFKNHGHLLAICFDRLGVSAPSADALKLIELCGMDPKVVTAKEMDALDVRFVRNNEDVMTWRSAMFHQTRPSSIKSWRLATSYEVADAKEHELGIQARKSWLVPRIKNDIRVPTLAARSESLLQSGALDSLEANGVYQVKLQGH